ncbi:NUDIX domain-containing protein [Rothia sp. AR01]|uniref:NUDIX domain-containing protein n=1 Tax=Rothia santali TaxID=2949643 RepID=A0A9X2HEG6_9MICC|nr:NUDIX domain-containing protein [Rothia santali]MCP3425342.1 NUDIX domain-containing protein [Rothia santali]
MSGRDQGEPGESDADADASRPAADAQAGEPATIPSACGVIVDAAGRILLVQRGHEPGKGLWSVPGGKSEPGETLRETAAREVLEETGLRVVVGRELWSLRVPAGAGREYEIHDFEARVVDGELQPADDAADARWVSAQELRELPLTDGLDAYLAESGVMGCGKGQG